MSKDFIEKSYNSNSISDAVKQEKQLSYFSTSEIQENRTDYKYITAWAERNYQTNDYFLNWVKSIFKTENFILFYKYLRYPLPTTRLIKNKIEPQLRRVFVSEDSDFKYQVKGKDPGDYVPDLKVKEFNNEVFNRVLYKHNSILITDLDSEESNKPYRYFVDIDKVLSIDTSNGRISRIAFKGCAVIEDQEIDGIVYIDDDSYKFYNKNKELLTEVEHDLGHCPAHFIIDTNFSDDQIVKASLFSFIREQLEEYTFLKTLQKMTEPNGSIPIVTKIDAESEDDELPSNDGQPNSDTIMGAQVPEFYNQSKNVGTGDLQPGTIHEIPISSLQGADGNINTDPVVNYLNFHYIPIEALDYLNNRVNELEDKIVSTIIGSLNDGTDQAQNETQIEKNIATLENVLTSLSEYLNRIRKLSDKDMLSLKYGKDMVEEVFIHYGTDFFLESQTKLLADFDKAPNTIERKNIIVRLNQNRYKNNPDNYARAKLLYEILPFASDKDFSTAISQNLVDNETKLLQTKFNYYISKFEALYGDIVTFFATLDINKSEKIVLVNNLIMDLVSDDVSKIEPQQIELNKQ